MRTSHPLVVVLVTFTVLTAGCAPQAAETSVPPLPALSTQLPLIQAPPTSHPITMPNPATATRVATVASPAKVQAGTNSKYGSILTDGTGFTLYLFTKDLPNTTTCYGKCVASWPPLLTNGNPVAGAGADPSQLSTIARTDGSTQVAYNGRPLYYYINDSIPGEMNGQSVGSVWFVISPAGDPIKQ